MQEPSLHGEHILLLLLFFEVIITTATAVVASSAEEKERTVPAGILLDNFYDDANPSTVGFNKFR